jgi:hypothetical protein
MNNKNTVIEMAPVTQIHRHHRRDRSAASDGGGAGASGGGWGSMVVYAII